MSKCSKYFIPISAIIWFLMILIIHCSLLITNCYSQWVIQNSGTPNHFYDVFFINTQTGWACGNNGTIVKTTNGGSNWFVQTSGTTFPLQSIHFVDSSIGYCAARVGYTIYKTTSGGNAWFTVLSTFKAFESIYFIDSLKGWASGTYNGAWVFRTTNGGISWDSVMVNTGAGNHVYFFNSQTGWVAAGGSMFRSTDGGVSWTEFFNSGGGDIAEFSFVNQNIGWLVILENWQVYKTTNGGINWVVMDTLPDCFNAHSIYFSSINTGWVSGDCGNMFKTTNGGIKWGQQNTSGSGFLSSVVFVTDSIGWSVGGGGRIIRTTTGWEYLTVISDPNVIPIDFKLYQNYPNPFNSMTKFKFQIPKISFVKLVIYDVLSKEVDVLVNEELKAGSYSVEWQAINYPSGVYVYTMITKGYRETKKMILAK